MKSKKWLILLILLLAVVQVAFFVMQYMQRNLDNSDAFSGATPLALKRKVPDGLSLIVDGKVKQEYVFSSDSFWLLAKARIRTPLVSPGGEILGAYIYTGVPALYFLEGIVPQKSAEDVFDRPLDMVVIFTSASGRKVCFSYGELNTIDDSLPVTLAYHREALLPTKKDPETYTLNKLPGNIAGLSLICPREPDMSRYLDNVERMTLAVLPTPDHLLPVLSKNKECISASVECIENNDKRPAFFAELLREEIPYWVRIGHGKGLKGQRPSTASGYPLGAFLRSNFPGCTEKDFFIFVGCDGYRGIFSGREIFLTAAGKSFYLLDTLDGGPMKEGIMVGAVSDFFIDRCVWGLSHVVRVEQPAF
ncbi:MAG: hypothetical protein KAW12_23185 [Candidatus Aminicenantes bacterium]|nr:hypothetical protein [Candidatus Aminicenantes bacterium]